MTLTTDATGCVLIQASGEQGRVVLIYEDRPALVAVERNNKIYTTADGLVAGEQFNAGRCAGIVKQAVVCAALLTGCCTTSPQPQPFTITFEPSERRQ